MYKVEKVNEEEREREQEKEQRATTTGSGRKRAEGQRDGYVSGKWLIMIEGVDKCTYMGC